jgi:patatin-like phospholipase
MARSTTGAYASFSSGVRQVVSDIGKLFHGDKPATFADVHDSEIKSINVRRGSRKVAPFAKFGKPSTISERKTEPVLDTVGLALSGGGVRSAAFSLGALQALNVAGAIQRIDYLSTVSGGGYIGSSLSAGMSLNSGEFPFPSELRKDEKPVLQHIRDYSNYLIPHGISDVIESLSIYLRGLAANTVVVLPWLLAAAVITVGFSPTSDKLLEPTIVKNIWMMIPGIRPFPQSLASYPFLLAILFAVFFGLSLVVWALGRSLRRQMRAPEIPGAIPTIFKWLLIVTFALFVIAFQPFVLDAMFAAEKVRANKSAATGLAPVLLVDWIRYVIIGLAPVAAIIGAVGNKLLWLIKRSTESSATSTKVKSFASKIAINLAALVVPLLLWVVYLQLAFWAISNGEKYAAPEWLQYLVDGFYRIENNVFIWPLPAVVGAPKLEAFISFYIFVAAVLGICALFMNQNANSLHRLYRDRLSKAFLVCPKDRLQSRDEEIETIDKFRLSELDEKLAPYHLINAALNLQASKAANRRGRNADFFLFSRNFIGSETTSFVSTTLMEQRTKNVDLATAMAISGAAASSNMGTSSIKSWTASLALLNVRLGYWLRNPKLLVNAALHPDDWPIPYFIYEMFGRLNENRKYVYVTDGGHVENLGVYELLRRRCCLIVVVDGEADPGMHFNSLVRLERYARIDLGIRIELPWQEIRSTTLVVGNEIDKRGDPGNYVANTGPHCAIGKIYYPGGEGRILYIKSSLTGDESSYVTDYKRRHASFPHETTGDQFFTEEQFEVYRALGFHAVQGVFSGRDRIAVARRPGRGPLNEQRARREEAAALSEITDVLGTRRTTVRPTQTPRRPVPEISDMEAQT